jgi:hypothetical protein
MVQETCTREKRDLQMLRDERVFPWVMAAAVIQLVYIELLPKTGIEDVLIMVVWMCSLRKSAPGYNSVSIFWM